MFNMRLIRSFPDTRSWIQKNVLFMWLGLLSNICATLILCSLITDMISFTSSDALSIRLLALVLLVLFRILTSRLASKASLNSSRIVKMQMREKLFEKMSRMGPASLSKWTTSELSQLESEGAEQLETYFASYIPQFFYALIAPATLFGLIVFWDWKSALVLLLCVPLIPASIVAVQKFAKKLLNKYWGKYTALSDSFLENLQGLTALKVYGADAAKHEEMNDEAEQFRKITMRVLIMQLNSISVMDLVAYGGSALGIGLAISGYAAGNLSFFHTISIILLSAEFFLPMRQLGSYFHISMNGSAAADKMFAILDEPDLDGAKKPENFDGFEIRNMSYTYPDGKKALECIDFTIPKTGFIGIVGESGSGKSTIAALLEGRIKGYEGSIQTDGMELSDLENDWLSSHILSLDFESTLFFGTIRENLKMADPDADDQKMIDALKTAGIWDFLLEQKGLDTKVSEKGSSFSGGQKQRIAFARALLKKSDCLIFDEATSSVDADTENAMMDQIASISNGKSVVCISHRLKNVQNADVIYVMKDGQIVQKGKHEELVSMPGEYQKLYLKQKELESYSSLSNVEDTAEDHTVMKNTAMEIEDVNHTDSALISGAAAENQNKPASQNRKITICQNNKAQSQNNKIKSRKNTLVRKGGEL